MARGIDAEAHEAALDATGRSVAVLGTGADVPYPAANRALHARLRETGAILAEAPPGTAAVPGAFPRRNRIIAALARVTVVVEAGARSGALITAGVAAELGRAVAALPGPIDAPSSAGANALLRDGAHVLTGVADLLTLAGVRGASSGDPDRGEPVATRQEPHGLGPDERAVWLALAGRPLDPDALVYQTGLPAGRCIAAVTTLELAGLLATRATGELERR
jgi:DNA processing protein